jgi:hypothetical protein
MVPREQAIIKYNYYYLQRNKIEQRQQNYGHLLKSILTDCHLAPNLEPKITVEPE